MFISGVAAPHAASHEPTGTDILYEHGANVDNPGVQNHTDISGSFIKNKETRLNGIPANSTLTISFEGRRASGAASSIYKIYNSGVAVGTQQTNNTSSYVKYEEDITGWNSGDLLQLYCAHTSGSGATTSNVKALLACFKESGGIEPTNQDP